MGRALPFSPGSFKYLPLATIRVVRAVKYVCAEKTSVPSVKFWNKEDLRVLAKAWEKPIVLDIRMHGTLLISSQHNLVRFFARHNVERMQPWIYSSGYTVVYFVWKNRDQEEYRDIYNLLLDEHQYKYDAESEPPNLFQHQISLIANKLIMENEDGSYPEGDQSADAKFCRKTVDRLRRNLQGKSFKHEARYILNNPSIFKLHEHTPEQEEDMRYFFKILENPLYPRDIDNQPDRRIIIEDFDEPQLEEEQPQNDVQNESEDEGNIDQLDELINDDNLMNMRDDENVIQIPRNVEIPVPANALEAEQQHLPNVVEDFANQEEVPLDMSLKSVEDLEEDKEHRLYIPKK